MKILDIPRSGSYGGVVSSHNRAGQYVRNRRAPVQPIGTGRRAAVRAAFSAAAGGFAGLTTSEQDAWSSFAASHPVTDSLGQSITLTGQQMYVRVNATRSNVGLASSTTPPGDLTLPDVSAATVTFSIASGISVDNYTGTAGQIIAFAFSPPVSSARRFWKTFWQPFGSNGHDIGTSAPHVIITSVYAAQFGAPVIGQRVFARLTPVSADGFNGTAVIISAIVAA